MEPQDHNQTIHRNPVNGLVMTHDLQVLFVKLEQILHLKVDFSDFGPVRDRGSLPYMLHFLSFCFFAVG